MLDHTILDYYSKHSNPRFGEHFLDRVLDLLSEQTPPEYQPTEYRHLSVCCVTLQILSIFRQFYLTFLSNPSILTIVNLRLPTVRLL